MKTPHRLSFKYLLPLMLVGCIADHTYSQSSEAVSKQAIYKTGDVYGTDSGPNSFATRLFLHRYLDVPMPEEKTAAEDTGGNWGSLTNGLQLSVRVNVKEFLLGEPIAAVVILRNTTEKEALVTMTPKLEDNFHVILEMGTNISHHNGRKLELPREQLRSGQGVFPERIRIPPCSQIAALLRLDELFDISHITNYSLRVAVSEHLSSAQAASGKATFRIVNNLSSSESAARNDVLNYYKRMQERAERKQRGNTNALSNN